MEPLGASIYAAQRFRESIDITRETFVKIEGGRQHIKLSQLRGIRKELDVSYEDILDQPGEEICRRIENLKMCEANMKQSEK